MTAKNPQTPPRPLQRAARDVVAFRKPLWRIHRVTGPHALPWDGLRDHGPISEMRWDPHPPPRGKHPGIGVSYASADAATAFAEVFQARRAITRSGDQGLAGWTPIRDLQLLDLTGDWALRNGASASLHAARKSTCRAWARAIHETWPDLDGLYAPSTMTGRPMLVLFSGSASTFPRGPQLSRVLSDPALNTIVSLVARELGWPVRRMP